MHSNWAAEHLLVIRTLMERSAIYRRALAPILLSLGVLGVAAAVLGWFLDLQTPRAFLAFWTATGLVGISGTYLMARRQAWRDADPFWSAPTRRVTQALLPPLFVGFAAGMLCMLFCQEEATWPAWWNVPLWMVLYGCAMHAAGFFMPRGMKLFGWVFILAGCGAALWLELLQAPASLRVAHVLMGSSFGGLHVAYGVYLFFTEKTNHEP